MGSDIPGLYNMSLEKRLKAVSEASDLDQNDLEGFRQGSTPMEVLDGMIENVVGTFELPVGIATNFRINGIDRLIPMAIEEASVVAAASKGAKIVRSTGGFRADTTAPVMIGQVQIVGIEDQERSIKLLKKRKAELIDLANSRDPMLVKFGGGCRDIEFRPLQSSRGDMLVLHLLVDCRDAMGANAVNTMAEAISPKVESITGGKVVLRIISNMAVHRMARATVTIPSSEMGGEEGVSLFLWAHELAKFDPFRAATHNKGVMNGVSAVVRATGNDTRAVEAGVHSYAAYRGNYGPVTDYRLDDNGDMVGSIEIPVPVGLIGGATKVHPSARAAIKLLSIGSASQLGEVLACVGLAQNLAALRALSQEGIQRGHMKLHARNLAIQAGAKPHQVNEVVLKMIGEGRLTASSASEIIDEMEEV